MLGSARCGGELEGVVGGVGSGADEAARGAWRAVMTRDAPSLRAVLGAQRISACF